MLPKNCRECLDLLDAYNDSRSNQAKLAMSPLPDSEDNAALEELRNQSEVARSSSEANLTAYREHMARHDERRVA
ncbi:MAG: hypothetical protein JWN34_4380 [Bryobacterales bacterium]|jgi:hypothetical protein|nr:hypothetical protein [Bryobacterales bacterium]